jgi:hypothetical protein
MEAPLPIKQEFVAAFCGSELKGLFLEPQHIGNFQALELSQNKVEGVECDFLSDIQNMLAEAGISSKLMPPRFAGIGKDGKKRFTFTLKIYCNDKNIMRFCERIGYIYSPQRDLEARYVLAYLRAKMRRKAKVRALARKIRFIKKNTTIKRITEIFNVSTRFVNSVLYYGGGTGGTSTSSAFNFPSYNEWKRERTEGLSDGLVWEKVEKCTPSSLHPHNYLVDIALPGPEHTFFANGILVHNCNITFYGKFSPQDISYIEKECLKWHSGLAFSAKDILSLEAGQFLAVYGTEARIIRVTEPRLTSHGAETPQLKFTAPKREQTEKAISGLAEAVMAALEAEKRETSELEKAKARIKQLEAELAEAKKEVERLKTALAVKETIKVEVKPAELKVPAELKLSEAKAVELQPKLPNIVESLDQDAKQVWALLRQRPGKCKAELMAAFGWGRRRLNRALRVLQNRRLLKVRGRKLYAAEPIV